MPQPPVSIRCPTCGKGHILSSPDDAGYRCANCSTRYPSVDGVVDLLPGFSGDRTPAQALMEWEPLVRIYESRLWRRSLAFAIFTRLSFESEYELISEAANIGEGARVLDLACGPGIYARRFARAVDTGNVIGLDLSLPMLKYGAKRRREEHLDNLTLVRGNALELPFDDGSFDVVNCCGALHLFPDPDRVLGEVSRVLDKGGRFTCSVVRRREGRLMQRGADVQDRISGVKAFSAIGLRQSLEQSGLSYVQVMHQAGVWLLMSGVKR